MSPKMADPNTSECIKISKNTSMSEIINLLSRVIGTLICIIVMYGKKRKTKTLYVIRKKW